MEYRNVAGERSEENWTVVRDRIAVRVFVLGVVN
jgi:hypothetical protein